MKRYRFPLSMISAGLILTAPAFADDFAVEKRTQPIPFLTAEGSKVDAVIEASAVQAIGDGSLLLIAHDKTTEMFVVEAATGQVVGSPLSTSKFPNDAKIPPKWEGLASDGEGFFYVVGTHSGKSDEDRPSRSFLFRFRMTDGTQGSPVAIEEGSVTRWMIEKSLSSALSEVVSDKKSVVLRKIEGLAIREVPAKGEEKAKKHLAIGLREPGDLVRVFEADITEAPADGAELALKPLFRFDAGKCEDVQSQLTSLEYVPGWQGFVVTTAAEDEQNAFHGNTLWFVSDSSIAKGTDVEPVVVDRFEPAMKVEGIAVLPEANRSNPNSVRFVLCFDNDAHTTHMPSRLRQAVVVRRPGR